MKSGLHKYRYCKVKWEGIFKKTHFSLFLLYCYIGGKLNKQLSVVNFEPATYNAC